MEPLKTAHMMQITIVLLPFLAYLWRLLDSSAKLHTTCTSPASYAYRNKVTLGPEGPCGIKTMRIPEGGFQNEYRHR